MNARTRDRVSSAATRFYTTESLGEKQALTPEGFLAVSDVPVARVGTMLYGPGEVPVPVGPDGMVHISRDEEAVFDPVYIASLVGKSVVDEHPEEDVDPSNWKRYEVGVVLNPRRGTGMQADLLVVDFLIKDAKAIAAVRAGKREVSCGYDAEYEATGPGKGRQTNLVGNHVALVEAGRCGSRCAIGDRSTVKDEDEMKTQDGKAKPNSSKWLDRLMAAFKAKDAEAFEEAAKEGKETMDEEPDEGAGGSEGGTHVHVHAPGAASKFTDEMHAENMEANAKEHQEFRDRLDAIESGMAAASGAGAGTEAAPTGDEAELEGELKEEAPTGTGDKAAKARDSAYLADSFTETVAMAEVLCPGVKVPTFDRAAKPADSFDGICKLRRAALDGAYATAEGKTMIDEISGRAPDLAGMKCNQVRTLFRAAAVAQKARNKAGMTVDGVHVTSAAVQAGGSSLTIAQLNARNAKTYADKN